MPDDVDRRPYTYEDAARICEVSPETIRARARRGRLKRGRPTNSGRPTVLLSETEIEAIRNGRPFRPDGKPPGRPDGQPAGHLSGLSSIVTQLEGRIAAQEAHISTLQAWLAATEQRAISAEARAEKAEQRLIEELARLATGHHPASEIVTLDPAEMGGLLADLAAEFEDRGQGDPEPEAIILDPVAEQLASAQQPESAAEEQGDDACKAEPAMEEGRRAPPRRRRLWQLLWRPKCP